MRLINPKRSNPFRSALDTFSGDSFSASFRSIRSVTSGFYRWLATTRFKVRGNTKTNKHRAFIDFYTDHDMLLNRYGNVFEANGNRFFNNNPRPMMALRSYELSTNQYRVLGQEYAEFDTIKFIDASGVIELELDHDNQRLAEFHDSGDAPVFVTVGYKIPNPKTGKTYWVIENEPVSVEILFNTFVITLNDDERDIRSDKEFVAALYAADAVDGLEGWYETPTEGFGSLIVPAIEVNGGNTFGEGEIFLPEIIAEGVGVI